MKCPAVLRLQVSLTNATRKYRVSHHCAGECLWWWAISRKLSVVTRPSFQQEGKGSCDETNLPTQCVLFRIEFRDLASVSPLLSRINNGNSEVKRKVKTPVLELSMDITDN